MNANVLLSGARALRSLVDGHELTVELREAVGRANAEMKRVFDRLATLNSTSMEVYQEDPRRMHEVLWECRGFIVARDELARATGEMTPARERESRQRLELLRIYRNFFSKFLMDAYGGFGKEWLGEMFGIELE